MALKHMLSKIVCAWEGHVEVPGTVRWYGDIYGCVCCARCRTLISRDAMTLRFRKDMARFEKRRQSSEEV